MHQLRRLRLKSLRKMKNKKRKGIPNLSRNPPMISFLSKKLKQLVKSFEPVRLNKIHCNLVCISTGFWGFGAKVAKFLDR